MWPSVFDGTFDCVETSISSDGLRLSSSQNNSIGARLPGVALMAILAAFIVGPQIALAGYALTDPLTRNTITQHPVVALQLALALVFWVGLVVWPLRLGLARFSRRRTVTIAHQTVRVADASAWSAATWTVPLSDYLGLAQHIKSSLSGITHQIVLVHPQRKFSLVLHASERCSLVDIDRLALQLGLPIIAASEIYRTRRATIANFNAVLPLRTLLDATP